MTIFNTEDPNFESAHPKDCTSVAPTDEFKELISNLGLIEDMKASLANHYMTVDDLLTEMSGILNS